MEKVIHGEGEIISQIYLVRGKKVMLDSDLARLYRVETRQLNQAVKRNTNRFPKDFMFQLSYGELQNLMSQIVISSSKTRVKPNDSALRLQSFAPGWGGRRKLPLVFQALRELVRQKDEPRNPIGFKINTP